MKKDKIAFGIFLDGLYVKIAQLRLSDKKIIIDSLDETLLSSQFFPQKAEKDELTEIPQDELDFEELEELDEESLELETATDFEAADEISDLVTKKEETLPGLKELQNFLQAYPLEKGKIAFNANEDQITYFSFDANYAKSKLRKKLLSEMLSAEELKNKDYILDYVLNPNKSGLAFVHRGKLILFHALRDINLNLSKQRYFYDHIDTNELSLINLVKNNYDFNPEEYVLLIYIGHDYKVGIVIKDGIHIRTFPIIVPDRDDIATRQAIYSKIILEQDISEMPITNNVILIGDHVGDEDLEFFRSKSSEDDKINRINISKLVIPEERLHDFDEIKLAKFAIPISLAWKVLEPKNHNFFNSNLLPQKVIENQKYFKIAWHGFVVLALIFYFTFSATINNLRIKEDVINYEQENYGVESELRRNRGLIVKLNEIKAKLSVLEANIQKVEKLTGNRNVWYHILDRYSRSLQRNPLSWLGNIASDNSGFSVVGFTTNRRSIIEFSDLFEQGNIAAIIRYELQDQGLWRYEISYMYPDAGKIREQEDLILKPAIEVTKEQEEAARMIQETEKETPTGKIPETKEISETAISREYRHALDVYFAGDYQSAIKLFADFLNKYPNHDMAYNANYYRGECLYLLKRYREAMTIFEKIFQDRGRRAPDALMMLGNSWEKLGELNMARASWNNLIADYPGSDLAVSAKYKLSKLEIK